MAGFENDLAPSVGDAEFNDPGVGVNIRGVVFADQDQGRNFFGVLQVEVNGQRAPEDMPKTVARSIFNWTNS